MKTRIVHTKIHEDKWFRSLTPEQKYLFVYYFTNHRIGHTGIYEISPEIVSFETGISIENLVTANRVFESAKKVMFFEDFVYVPKASIYGGYLGSKNNAAYKKELQELPKEAKQAFNLYTLSIQYAYPIDTPINHKSEIINHKSQTINQKQKVNFKKTREQLQKMGIIKSFAIFVLLLFPFLIPFQSYAKTVRVSLTLKTRLVNSISTQQTSLTSKTIDRPRLKKTPLKPTQTSTLLASSLSRINDNELSLSPYAPIICKHFTSNCQEALLVAWCESGIQAENWYSKWAGVDIDTARARGYAVGLFQILSEVHKTYTFDQLLDPDINAGYAKRLYDAHGWYPWAASSDCHHLTN